jgi:hypothetical protein
MGRLSDDELDVLLRGSMFLIYMSLYEGFGLPIIEALMRNVTCLISDIPVFKELFDLGCVFSNPTNINEISQRIVCLIDERTNNLTDNHFSDYYKNRYNWDHSAQVLINAVENIK